MVSTCYNEDLQSERHIDLFYLDRRFLSMSRQWHSAVYYARHYYKAIKPIKIQ